MNLETKNTTSPIQDIEIPIDDVTLKADLVMVPDMKAIIIFAHGSGSSRKSPRNQQVASDLNRAGFGTLLFDLLTDDEVNDQRNAFDIELLADRLAFVTKWLHHYDNLQNVPFGLFGASTGAAAAIVAASQISIAHLIFAIVSRGGRPDLAGAALKLVKAPTLFIVGSRDFNVIELNRQAQNNMSFCELSIVPGATHLFEEPGTMEEVSKQARMWFRDQLPVQRINQKPKLNGTDANL